MVDKARRPGESFADWRARLKGEEQKPEEPAPSSSAWDQSEQWKDLVPQVYEDSDRSEDDREVDRALETIDILDAYRVWCGKMTPDAAGKTEGIMVSCPNPSHPDGNPSAWINTDKQTWFCGGCDEGGDKYDIAAMKYGYDGYKTDPALFMKLRKQMAMDFGWTIKKVPGGQIIVPPHNEGEDENKQDASSEPSEEDSSTSNVVSLLPEPDEQDEEITVFPKIEWRNIVPRDTFLWEYMQATTNDDSPEEYHFWHGITALGHAAGKNAWLDDTRPVYGNILLCILGATGQGKSRSREWLTNVMEDVLPFKVYDEYTTGCKQVSVSGSGEYLVSAFVQHKKDPTTGGLTAGMTSVNGILDYGEFARLMKTVERQGSNLEHVIMDFADTRKKVTAASMSSGDKVAFEPFCSITTTTQPRAVRSILGKNQMMSGFLNRWAFVGGPAKRRETLGGKRSNITVDLEPAKLQLKWVSTWAGVEREVEWSDESAAAADKALKEVHQLMEGPDKELFQRLDLWLKKLCLLLTINRRQTQVLVEDVKAARELIDYMVACYGILDENIGVTQMRELEDDVMRIARLYEKRNKSGVTASEIRRQLHRKPYSILQIKQMLEALAEIGRLELVKTSKSGPGRPTARYAVVND